MSPFTEWRPLAPEKPSMKCKKSVSTPLVIDLGSANTRVGLKSELRPLHVFPTRASRFRDRKSGEQRTVVGNDILLEILARANSKTPFEAQLITNWDAIESILDYACHLTGYKGNNTIMLSTPPLYPQSIKSTFEELLSKGYNSKVEFFTDTEMAAKYVAKKFNKQSYLHIHLGSEAVYLTPFVDNQLVLNDCKRINWAGRHAIEFLQNLLVLKYPTFPQPVTQLEVQQMFEKYCFVAPDYKKTLTKFMDIEKLKKLEQIVQMPFPEKLEKEEKEREKDQNQVSERRKESGRRLQEQAAKARQEKLEKQARDLENMKLFVNRLNEMDESDAIFEATEQGYTSLADLHKTYKSMETQLRRAKGETIEDTEPITPLLNVPDEELNEQELSAKRRQKLLKASYDARQRIKQEKLFKKEQEERAKREEEEWRLSDLKGWSDSKKKRLQEVLNMIKEREKLRTDSRHRFRQSLEIVEGQSKRKETEDEAIARLVETEADSGDDEPENLDAEAEFLRGELLEFDPSFSLEEFEGRRDWRDSTVSKFLWGAHTYDPENIEQQYQLNLNIERVRAIEPLFDPSMVGVDQAGIAEISTNFLLMNPLLNNTVILTGGLANIKGLKNRLLSELTANLPVESKIEILVPERPELSVFEGLSTCT